MKPNHHWGMLLVVFTATAFGYEIGWEPQSFYEAVQFCRSSVVYPAASDYKKRGLQHNRSEDELDDEVLKMIPVFDHTATRGCFCVVNEIAKDHPASDYPEKLDLARYMSTPRCESEFKAPIIQFQGDRENIERLMLQ